jgi:2'-5' RNA ligase
VRIFVALDIPEAVRASLAQLRERFEKICRGARWVRSESIHLTLKFIGEVPAEMAERIRVALQDVRAFPSFELSFCGLGFFPSERRPRVFWMGIEGAAPLSELSAAIETRLAPLGIPRETRGFVPHLTLARFNSAASSDSGQGLDRLREAAAENAASEFGRMTAREFHLFQSVLKPSSAEYTRLASYPFSSERTS